MSDEKSLDQKQRLLAIREHLRIRTQVDAPEFADDVAQACSRIVEPIIRRNASEQGEKIINAIAHSLGVRFEEVESKEDIKRVEQKYLHEKRELGFGLVEEEFSSDDVDALLIQRTNADARAPDRWIAVLNLQKSRARAYWSRPHELVHRIAEPPQKRLPFYRHKSDYGNKLERLIDLGTSGLAFPEMAFAPIVKRNASKPLTWTLIQSIREQFAPTASLLSVAKATVQRWPAPAILVVAEMKRKSGTPNGPRELRVATEGFSRLGETCGVFFFRNMRVPQSSVAMSAYRRGQEQSDRELLSIWRTSDGNALPDRMALVSGKPMSEKLYILVSPE